MTARPASAQKFQLIARLLQEGRLARAEIAQTLQVHDAAVKRFERELKQAFPSLTTHTVQGEVFLSVDQREDRPDEALILGLGFAIKSLRALRGSRAYDALEHKLAQALENSDLMRAKDVLSAFYVVPSGEPTHDPTPIVQQLEKAWLERRRVHLRYQSADNAYTSRVVEPYAVLLRGDHLLLVAGTRKNRVRTIRNFRIDRIREITIVADGRFQRPSHARFQPANWLADTWGVFVLADGQPERVRVRVGAHWVGILQNFRMHASQEIAPELIDGWLEVCWDLVICPEFETWIFGCLPHVQVLEPASLRDKIKNRLIESLEAL